MAAMPTMIRLRTRPGQLSTQYPDWHPDAPDGAVWQAATASGCRL